MSQTTFTRSVRHQKSVLLRCPEGGANGTAVSAAAVGGGDDDILFPLFIARGGGIGTLWNGIHHILSQICIIYLFSMVQFMNGPCMKTSVFSYGSW